MIPATSADARDHLISLYNEIMRNVISERKGFIGFNASNRDTSSRLTAFLHVHQLQAGPFITACFVRYQWARWPKFDALATAASLAAYRAVSVSAHHTWRTLSREEAADRAPLISKGREIIKQRVLNELGSEVCRERVEWTGGYHAASKLCATCSMREVCSRDSKDVLVRL